MSGTVDAITEDDVLAATPPATEEELAFVKALADRKTPKQPAVPIIIEPQLQTPPAPERTAETPKRSWAERCEPVSSDDVTTDPVKWGDIPTNYQSK